MFEKNTKFPREEDIERLSKYKRLRKIFDGKTAEVYERATEILRDSPYQKQLRTLYIAVNLMDILTTKPADLLIGDGISVESGKDDTSPEQKALNRIIEENDLPQLIHETVVGSGIRGDGWVKTYYAPRQDVTAIREMGLEVHEDLKKPEPIIEAVPAHMVFPETAKGSLKKFKAINICRVEYVEETSGKIFPDTEEVPYLHVERHVPGYIIYKKYKLADAGVDNSYEVPVPIFTVLDEVATGRDNDVEETGVPHILVQHVPYKSIDDGWKGIGGIEKLESVLTAINDRLVQIDYILWKHSDPTSYGPDIEGKEQAVALAGKYIPLSKDDPTPGYMTWDGRLESAFKELDYLLSIVFQMSETPQWLFGTTITQDKGGTGTSHTDSRAIKMRLMPILSKVERIKLNVDRAFRDVLWLAQELEVYANEGVEEFQSYTPQYPKIYWYDPMPRDMKEEAEIMAIRTQDRPTLDQLSSVKRLDRIDDIQAREILERIKEDQQEEEGFVNSSIFNEFSE